MNINLAGIEAESFVDGEGVRYVIFTQGCPHHCEGCHNPITWDFGKGKNVAVDTIVEELSDNKMINGITFSGGEPFMQAKALTELAQRVHKLDLNVWCYTGYTYEEIMARPEFVKLLCEVDVLVDGEFVLAKRDLTLAFRGSSNQRIIDVKQSLDQGHTVLYIPYGY